MDTIDGIHNRLLRLYEDALVWASDNRSPWASQLLDDIGRALGTARWLEGDIEKRRMDAEKLKAEGKNDDR